MATKPDIIVIDEEKYPHIATVGTKCGSWMNLEYYELEDTHFQYIPPHVHYLRFDYDTATYGMRLWGETRNMKSEYGVDDSGTTLKEKVEVDFYLEEKQKTLDSYLFELRDKYQVIINPKYLFND